MCSVTKLQKEAVLSEQDGHHTLPLLSLSLSNLLGILCAPELRRSCHDKNTNLTEDI